MDRNSLIGFVLIALIMMGFFGYQSRQVKKQMAYQAQLDSLAAVEAYRQDSIRAAYLAEHPEDTVVAALPTQAAVYSDSLLNAAARAKVRPSPSRTRNWRSSSPRWAHSLSPSV